jgi:tetratricopeptide (TPR) repeat protein
MISKNQLISIIESAIQEFRGLGDYYTAEKLEQKGSLRQWAVRDDVIHCAYYIRQFADRLAWPRDHEKVDGSDYLKVNDEVWEAHQSENWQAALQMLEDACRSVIAGLEPLSSEELNDNAAFTWLGGQSVAQYIPGLIFVHGLMHIQYGFMREGMTDAAIASADKAFKLVDNIDSSEVGRGRNLYNKACSYALAGRKSEAITMVKEAVKLAPNLLEWSKQDSDLDSLREDPQFKAIYH